MISPEIIHRELYQKEAQTGSYCGMRYPGFQRKNEEDCMDVTIWPSFFAGQNVPPSKRQQNSFP